MNKLIYIYTLTCPNTGQVRYVGKTIQSNPKDRYSSHISLSKKNGKKDYCHCWIRSLLDEGLKPEFNIIEETYEFSREAYWIAKYRENGYNLTNLSTGGELGPVGATWRIAESKRKGFNNWCKKTVYQWTTDGNLVNTFPSLKDAIKSLGAGGTLWMYIRDKKVYRKIYILTYKDTFHE